MAKKSSSVSVAPGVVRTVKEKSDFCVEGFVNVDGVDVRCYAKCSVDFKKPTFKVKPIVTLVHKWDYEEIREMFVSLIETGTETCREMIAEYQGEMGIGAQGDLFEGASAGDN